MGKLSDARKWDRSRRNPRRININDRLIQSDNKEHGGLRGEVIFGKGRHIVHYIDPYGKPAYRTEFEEETDRMPNIVPIGAYQFAFDKLFNIGLDQESTLRIGDLNDEAPMMKIGVKREEYRSIHYNAECSITNEGMKINSGINISANNFIFGFMMGDGGAREDGMTAIAPDYKRRNLYHPIPFRMSNDGFPNVEGKYFGKSIANDNGIAITSSFVKLFDNPAPHIVHVWATGNTDEFSVVDDTVFASTSSIPIESYVEMNISVNIRDGRGYFTTTKSTPRVNEFALVSGWFNNEKNDYEALRIFTHFTRPSIALTTDDSVEAIYRLYAR